MYPGNAMAGNGYCNTWISAGMSFFPKIVMCVVSSHYYGAFNPIWAFLQQHTVRHIRGDYTGGTSTDFMRETSH